MIKQKTVVFYDNMASPTYIRVVSERLNLDHIIYTESTENPLRYCDLNSMAETKLFEKILFCSSGASCSHNSLYIRHPKGSVAPEEEIAFLNDDWLNIDDIILVDSINDKEAIK